MPRTLKQKKEKAVNYAKELGKLLDPKYFDKASQAIDKKDKKALKAVMKEAGIPETVLTEIREDYATSGWGWGWD